MFGNVRFRKILQSVVICVQADDLELDNYGKGGKDESTLWGGVASRSGAQGLNIGGE